MSRLLFAGVDLTSIPASRRARAGIGRTFQRIELFDSLSVLENVALGREARLAGSSPLRTMVSRRREAADVAEASRRAVEQCGLSDVAGSRAGVLPTGQRRLVELARALAGGFRMLLLDEPSSGLDTSEVLHFSRLLKETVAFSGVGVVVVEHDMGLIADVCDHVYVLDYGRLIFEGPPEDVLTSDVVRDAYLGSAPVAAAGTPR